MKRLILILGFLFWALPAFAQIHTFQTDDQTWQSWLTCINELAPCSTVSHGGGGGSTPGGSNNSVQINSSGTLAGISCLVNQVIYGQAGAPVCSGTIALTAMTASVNNVINVMAPTYGAKGDGATDDINAGQQAIWDATTNGVPFGTCATGPHKAVYLPVPPVCYAHSAPLRQTCPGLELFGNAGSALCNLGYVGDVLIQQSAGSPVSLNYASGIVAGTGNSLVSANGPTGIWIDLAHYLDDTKLGGTLGQVFASHFNIAFFMKPTSFAGDQIISSNPGYPFSGSGAFSFRMSGTNTVFASVNTTGGSHNFGACPVQNLNTVYEIEMDWDGTTYRVWQGTPGGTAVSCDTWTSSNPIAQQPYEEIDLPDGGPAQFWPDGSSLPNNAFAGDLDSVQFERLSVHTSAYTVPTVKFAGDVNTWLLCNFLSSLNGTQVCYSAVGTNNALIPVYFTIHGGGVIGATVSSYVHDLELCAWPLSGAGRFDDLPLTGIYAVGANNSRWTNLSCSNAIYEGAEFGSNDYVSRLDNWNSTGGHVGLNFGSAWNDSWNTNAHIAATDVAGEIYMGGGGGPHHDTHTYIADNSSVNRYGVIENQSSGLYDYLFIDQEAPNANWKASILQNAPALASEFNSSSLTSGSTGVYVQQDNGGVGGSFNATDFAVGGTPPEVFNITNGLPSSPIYSTASLYPGMIPVSNLPQWVVQPGITPTYYLTIAASTLLAPEVAGDTDFNITLNGNAPILFPKGLVLTGANAQSQFEKVYVCLSGSRQESDFVTNTDTSLVSATVAFVCSGASYPCATGGDVGRRVFGPNVPVNDTIAAITNTTTASLNIATTGTGTGLTETLGNFFPTWTNGVGAAVLRPLIAFPTYPALGSGCITYNFHYRDPMNIDFDSFNNTLD